ncbi:MAG TPA: ABC transporter ATP-binding protein [Roseiarcus sp.]|jgi:multiple sugar transport system ATP-binding protein
MADVRLAGVTKRFGENIAVDDLSLDVENGSFVVLLGPTGAGKTTTLRLVAGLETPDRGQIVIGQRDVTKSPPAARDVAFVFQQYSLYPHLSVYDNLAFPLRSPTRRTEEAEVRRKVTETAALLRIGGKLGNRATNLSGGEMQRVAIGRALVRRPSIYLMDEPLSSLDAKLRAELRLELKRIQIELGATFLYVTHDQIEAMTMATTIGVIESGRIAQIGSPRQIYENPNSLYVAARLGQPAINLMPRQLLPGLPAPPEAATIGARTEHLRIAKAQGAAAHGQVTWIEHLGDQNHLHITIEQHDVVTLVDPDAGLAVGDDVGVVLVNPLFFDRNGARVAT